VTVTGSEPATVAVKLGKRTLGSGTASKSGALSVKLGKKAVTSLEDRNKAKLTLQASVDFGLPAKASGTLK
jgi:hypothetical protein